MRFASPKFHGRKIEKNYISPLYTSQRSHQEEKNKNKKKNPQNGENIAWKVYQDPSPSRGRWCSGSGAQGFRKFDHIKASSGHHGCMYSVATNYPTAILGIPAHAQDALTSSSELASGCGKFFNFPFATTYIMVIYQRR